MRQAENGEEIASDDIKDESGRYFLVMTKRQEA